MPKPDTCYLYVRRPIQEDQLRPETVPRRARPRASSRRDLSAKVRAGQELVRQIVEYHHLRTELLQQAQTRWSEMERLARLDEKFIEPSPAERRRCRRFRCDLLSWLRRHGAPCHQRDIVLVADLGAQGARIRCNPGLSIGEVVTLSFRVGDTGIQQMIDFDAHVVRLDDGAGLQFADRRHEIARKAA